MSSRFATRNLLLSFLVLTASAPAAFAAGGMNLSWSDCGTAGQLQRNFACDSNGGVNTLVASVVAPAAMGQLNGQESSLELATDQETLSNWWQLGSGGCRATALSGDFNFSAGTACANPWGGGAWGGVNYTPSYNGPNRGRIRTICAIPGSTSIDGSSEYYLFKVLITNANSTGAGACSGCTDGAVIAFRSVTLTQPIHVGDYTMVDQPLSRNYVLWQPNAPNSLDGIPLPTPARPSSWGAVKSLYR